MKLFIDVYFLVVLSLIITKIASYSSKLIDAWRCKKPFTVGTMIMGSPAMSSNLKSVIVSRNGTALNSGDVYYYSEILQVSISDPTSIQYVIETNNGKFESSKQVGCDSKRFYDDSSKAVSVNLVMPSEVSTADVKVWLGWAKGNPEQFFNIHVCISYKLKVFSYAVCKTF
jgi:hypothetical protein